MQLKECTEDTADNKVQGDWMLINLCVLHSAQYFCISSSLLSCSRLSRPPLKGMTRAPGSWPSTHSLIFSSLPEMETRKHGGLKVLLSHGRVCYPRLHEYSWRRGWLSVRLFVWDCVLEVGWSFLFFHSFTSNSEKFQRVWYKANAGICFANWMC